MAPKNYPRAQALLKKFYEGKCTPEELALLDSWYDGLGDMPEDILPADASRYQQQFLENFRNSLPSARIVWWKRPVVRWTAAASILLMAGAGYLWKKSTGHTSQLAWHYNMVTNETNVAKLVVLPDSSHIWLNTAATLRWRSDFNQQNRSVQLTGEGFFDVQGQTGKPFVIHTRDLAIQVLGTQFNVEAYAAEGISRVSLVKGKVKVQAHKSDATAAVLKPGTTATYFNEDKVLGVASTPATDVAAWRNGAFNAIDLPFKDAVSRLCADYGYSVKWENTQGIDKYISASFKKESFGKMLSNLCYISRKQYRISNRQVTIF